MFGSSKQICYSGKFLGKFEEIIVENSPEPRSVLGLGIGFIQNLFIVGIPTFVGHDGPQREEIQSKLICQGP
jgi:hypothetical protein